MKIAIVTVQVPFIKGGAEILAEMLKAELIRRGHTAEIISIPFKWYPWESLIDSMNMGRMMGLADVVGEKIDRVIALKFPAYYIRFENKVLWLLHQHRQAYDLWGTKYGDIHLLENGEAIRSFIKKCDDTYLPEAGKIFTIAQTTTDRLLKYNGIHSEVLYHPPKNHDKLYCNSYGNFIFYPSRIDTIKRQILLVEAAQYLKTEAKVVIAGGGNRDEIQRINDLIEAKQLQDKVKLTGFISDEELREYYADCLGVYFGAYDEDYGYITLEAFFSEKPVLVHSDAGGPLEFVENEVNGYIIDTDPKVIAEKIDFLFEHRDIAKQMGQSGRKSLTEKNINWDYVIDNLLNDQIGDTPL